MKVLLINPWGANNDMYYTSGLISGMNKQCQIDFVGNYYYHGENPNGTFFPYFFRHSQRMETSILRKGLRGFEYIYAWKKIIDIVRKNDYDIVHVLWLLMYPIDVYFLSILKKQKVKMVLTAHNVIPHVNGDKYIPDLNKIYNFFDRIIVHGASIKKEFIEKFPEYSNRISINYHGEYYKQKGAIIKKDTSDYKAIDAFREKYEVLFIDIGGHYFSKGTDRLVDVWLDYFSEQNAGLIIAGRIDQGYEELIRKEETIKRSINTLLINGFIDDDLLNYLIDNSDCIIIPYRHASMSGIIYTAANYMRTVICTNAGALSEYLENEVDSIVCNNDEEGIKTAIDEAICLGSRVLRERGQALSRNIHKKYNWDHIAETIVNEVYK